jgi:nucleotide-binding universal stress UspA family protein
MHAVHGGADPFVPFAHALSLAYQAKGTLEIVDITERGREHAELGVRDTLQEWGVLPEGAERADVAKVGLRVKKILKKGNRKKEIGKRLRRNAHDLLVLGTGYPRGVLLFGRGLVEYLAHSCRQTTLYIPHESKPFVDLKSGRLALSKVLVPVARDPSVRPALELLEKVLALHTNGETKVTGLHAGRHFPHVPASAIERIAWHEIVESRSHEHPACAIVEAAHEQDADLIVMSTNGRDTFTQKIVGSFTEQVLRRAPCPVLAVAVG